MRNYHSTALQILLVSLLIAKISSLMFCFQQKHPSQKAININNDQNNPQESIDRESPLKQIRLAESSELRSYHPHYLNSLSYPHPITPHIYFGEMYGANPVLLVKNMDNWDVNSIQKLSVNGIKYEDASAKSYSLQRQQATRYMLILQIQNSYLESKQYSLNVFKRKDRFLIVCEYEDKFNAFVVYLTKNDKIAVFQSDLLKGVKINVRNESLGDARRNWKFTQSLYWRGSDNVNMKFTSFTGFVLEVEFSDKSIKKDVHLNLQELSNNDQLSLRQFAKNQEQTNLQELVLPKIKTVVKNQNCANAASQKIFEGLSYQYGSLIIKDGNQNIPNNPQSLLSFSPSRKRFPWGFLWDDGFHCEVAVRKDEHLTFKVIMSWLDTMLENGWIPREQNRGAEREQLCSCPKFMQKDIKDGNPPTLILALQYLKRYNKLNNNVFPHEYWDKIKKWYDWFLTTQKDDKQFLFRWKDSINQEGASFTSGMDDFPRPYNPKAHVDLQAWMYFFTDFMIATANTYSQSSAQYTIYFNSLKESFKLLIEKSTHVYKDLSFDGSFSEHFGYPNILPIAFGVPDYLSVEYNATIAMIKEHLDTGAGLSSISKHSRLYLENNDAYWKGPVWVNINYLFLRGLKLYYPKEKELYDKIRKDLLKTVCGNWEKSGYFYQNYKEGKGSFSYPFNGWTSLIAIISEENY